MKILVRIGVANPLPAFGPFGVDLAAAHDAARSHLEHVGKIATEGHLQLKAYGLDAVVGDVDVFVQAAADRSTDGEA
jgi:hypothetical protein